MGVLVKVQGILIMLYKACSGPLAKKNEQLDLSNVINVTKQMNTDSIKSLASLAHRICVSSMGKRVKATSPVIAPTLGICLGARLMQDDVEKSADQILDKTNGKCRYCGSSLDLRDGTVRVGFMVHYEWTVTGDWFASAHVAHPHAEVASNGTTQKADDWAYYRCLFCKSGNVFRSTKSLGRHLARHVWMAGFRSNPRICR
jgi:hypothetical protein